MCKLLDMFILQTQLACLGKTSTLTRKKPHKTFKLSPITHTTPGRQGKGGSNCNSRLHSRYSLVCLRVEVAVAASLIGLMHDKSWLWLGLTVHQMVMVTTGSRGVAGRKGEGCCLPVMRWQHFHFNADSISTSLTGEASSYALLQSAEGGTGEGGAGPRLGVSLKLSSNVVLQ